MPCLLPIIVRAKAHSVVITNPSLKAGVNTKATAAMHVASITNRSLMAGVMAGWFGHKQYGVID